jgi:hypothetical protein
VIRGRKTVTKVFIVIAFILFVQVVLYYSNDHSVHHGPGFSSP